MSMAPVTAASPNEENGSQLRMRVIGALFAVVQCVPTLLRPRRNAHSWFAVRILLGAAGAALVILPLSLWNSWLAAIAGLAMFFVAALLPPARPYTVPEEKARELGALSVLSGGKYQAGITAPESVRLFVGSERLWALDSHFQPLLVIPAVEITSVNATRILDRWILQIGWSDNSTEFFYEGIFAQHQARIAQSSIGGIMQVRAPVRARSRAASA